MSTTTTIDEMMRQLEEVCGGTRRAAEFLGVNYNGGYATWKSGKREMPAYIANSIEAHLALGKGALRQLIAERLG